MQESKDKATELSWMGQAPPTGTSGKMKERKTGRQDLLGRTMAMVCMRKIWIMLTSNTEEINKVAWLLSFTYTWLCSLCVGSMDRYVVVLSLVNILTC